MPDGTCSLPDCGKPLRRAGYCYGHYMKAWRYGTPTPDHPSRVVDIKGQRFGTLTVIERRGFQWHCECDCGRTRLVSAGDLNRHGDANTCGHRPTHRRRDDAGYSAAHDRVRRDIGPVHDYCCVNCGEPAKHWSYDHDDPDELLEYGLSANAVAYSLKPEHYSPRCVSCHKRYDLDRKHAAELIA